MSLPRCAHAPGDALGVWAEDYFGRHAGYANQLLWQESFEASKAKGTTQP